MNRIDLFNQFIPIEGITEKDKSDLIDIFYPLCDKGIVLDVLTSNLSKELAKIPEEVFRYVDVDFEKLHYKIPSIIDRSIIMVHLPSLNKLEYESDIQQYIKRSTRYLGLFTMLTSFKKHPSGGKYHNFLIFLKNRKDIERMYSRPSMSGR